ncbi:thiamine phosphate synthase [Limibacter armeniacum]|uniref:thiamine phosphate synthase n=1 Tax=Limibacter armeniacum TaxID=466084 RepID=UPI002FE5AD6B
MINKKEIARLHFITQPHPTVSYTKQVELACKGDVRWIQLREKTMSDEQLRPIAEEMAAICKNYGATLVINDRVELAADINADGVHIGKEDMSPVEARKILGAGKTIGGTANTLEDMLKLADMKVDYIGLGPFRFTATKKKLSPILGLEGYANLLEKFRNTDNHTPVIGIGGIEHVDIPELLKVGLHGIAVSSLIAQAEDAVLAAEYTNLIISQQTI